MISRQRFLNPKLQISLNKRAEKLSKTAVKDILEWEFKSVDSDGNQQLDDNELKEIERGLLHVEESCIIGFLKSCDLDGADGISLREWFTCFPDG
ncbi:hypothetical protein QZH41_014117, partial [Actinostola sp. cb2023]